MVNKKYVVPQVEIIEMEVEKGFQTSGVEAEQMGVRDDISVG